ncbi:rho GTPase-activating protein 25 [Pteropus vampyrus]|uniref:Rho GTPase-activating protein 25 n=1 Tax=Pteropus vampyrus TaxID=132908 RepID=A0A6P3QGY1_PTEVA|nr:rho GTPase-activating protein 25 [Pteropus vampyrus]
MAFDTWQENSGGASFLPAGCVEWGQGCCGSAGEGPHLTVRSERRQQLLLGEECPATSGAAAAAWDSLTLNRQSQILFSTLSCQILTPTQEKGSTFCQMLRQLPLQNAPANLSLRRMRGPTRLPDCARWASGSRLLLGLARSRSVMTGEQMAAFHQSSTPNPLERPIKMGWLKKQRSIVKNWQQRYFVLRAQQLYYYKDEEDVKPQGYMYLPGSTIKEIATNPEEAGKFVFEVIPASWDQSRTGQDSYVLMASSQAEMEEWVKFLRRVAGTPSGAVFGQRLDETVAYEQKFGPHLVPILVEKCAEFILEHGLNEEGIFRLPGQDNLVKQLRDAFDAGERPSFDRYAVLTLPSPLPQTVTQQGRLFQNPHPRFPEGSSGTQTGLCASSEFSCRDLTGTRKCFLLATIYFLLWDVLAAHRFLHEIQLNCAVNKMSVDNLATVIGVNLIRSKVEDPAVIMKGTPQIQRVMTMMIRDHEVLFPKSKDAPLSPPAQKNDPKKPPVARSSVGWDATEDAPISRTDSFSNATKDSEATSPTGQQPNDGCLGDGSKPPREKPGDWKLQSRKRTQTLPNRKCFLTAAFQGANSNKVEIFKNEFWSPSSEVKAEEGHRRTLSQGVPNFSDIQRTSTYDNVPTLPGSPGNEAGAVSFHACDSKKDTLAKSNRFFAWSKIQNLEKENYDVWAKVVRLSEELEKEKKNSAALEISLRNVERCREDVEKRNKALEEEVKEFVKSVKEPKTDA